MCGANCPCAVLVDHWRNGWYYSGDWLCSRRYEPPDRCASSNERELSMRVTRAAPKAIFEGAVSKARTDGVLGRAGVHEEL